MNKDPLNFGVSGIFGRMGQNPSINALTNANAIAQQQMAQQNIQPLGSGTTYRPDMSQQVMTGSFDPLTQQVGMGIFGDQNARNMAVRGSGIMKHADEEETSLKEEIKKIRAQYENEEKEGEFYEDPGYEKARARLAAIKEEHKNK